VTHDYAAKPGAIPLPATMTIDLGNHISDKSASGMRVRLYSDHPFRPRKDGGPRDVFEREALDKLLANPDEAFWSFEDVDRRPSLRYATARRMDQTCVRCHNGHPDSPKKDWKVGDVPGVLEVIRPLDRDVARARQGLRGTLVAMGVIGGSLLAATGVSLIIGNRRRNSVTSSQSKD
jgi:adenylate cyclase